MGVKITDTKFVYRDKNNNTQIIKTIITKQRDRQINKQIYFDK